MYSGTLFLSFFFLLLFILHGDYIRIYENICVWKDVGIYISNEYAIDNQDVTGMAYVDDRVGVKFDCHRKDITIACVFHTIWYKN